jgi:hypothetical protein
MSITTSNQNNHNQFIINLLNSEIMKSFTSFFRILSLVVFCSATTFTFAQVGATAGYYTTGNPYTYSATAGSGSTAVVALIKPTSNQIRISSYFVAAAGAVTWKANYDFSSANIVKVAMLTDNRVVVARAGTKLRLTTFDINSSTGVLTKKNDYESMTLNSDNLAIVKLSNNSFATLVRHSDGNQVRTFTVDANGVITMKSYLTFNGSSEEVDLVRLSDTRFVAAIKLNINQVKFICFDVAPNTYAITERSYTLWNNSVKKLSLSNMSSSRFALFTIDATDRLDAISYFVNAAGALSFVHSLSDIKKTGTNEALLLKEMDAQTTSTAPGKILIGGARTNENLCVISVSFTNGLLTVQNGYYPNAPNVTQASAGLINGNMMIGAFRQVEDGKYHIRSYNWN